MSDLGPPLSDDEIRALGFEPTPQGWVVSSPRRKESIDAAFAELEALHDVDQVRLEKAERKVQRTKTARDKLIAKLLRYNTDPCERPANPNQPDCTCGPCLWKQGIINDPYWALNELELDRQMKAERNGSGR